MNTDWIVVAQDGLNSPKSLLLVVAMVIWWIIVAFAGLGIDVIMRRRDAKRGIGTTVR